MTITNTELAAQLQDVATSWQSFNLQQLNWLTTTADTVTLTDHVTLQEITVKSLYKIEADYDTIFDDATGDLAQISQMLTDTQALQASMTTMHDAVVAYDVTFTGYLAQTAQDVTDCDDSAAAAAASALAAANSALAAGGHADDAEAARDLALGYRNEAETFKTQAQTAKTDAESEAAAALTSRNEALTFRNEAETAKTAAEAAETNAATSETNAASSETRANEWANNPEGSAVTPGEYSAFHWKEKCKEIQSVVATSESAASASATAAAASESAAATSASSAASSDASATLAANAANTHATNAGTHAGNASASATNAATSELKAQQWANEAEDIQVEPGLFSALHHASKAFGAEAGAINARDKAEEWAQNPYGVEVETGQYSSSHWAVVSLNFANADEDVEVIPGKYSAKHWAAKAEDFWGGSISSHSDVDTTGVSNGDTLIYNSVSGLWEPGAGGAGEPNNISDTNATDLTDGGASSLHYHTADRNRANHTGTQTASTISDFDTEVSNNASVVANTAKVSANGSVATHSDVTLSSPVSGQLLTYNGSTWTNQTPNTKESLWVSLGTTGGLSGLTTENTAEFNTVDWNSNGSVFTLSSNELTVNKSGVFSLKATMSVGMTDNNASTVRAFFQKSTNGGTTWSLIPNTLGHVSIHAAYKHGTFSLQALIDVNSGDMFRVRMFRLNGSSTSLFQVNNSSQLTITEI